MANENYLAAAEKVTPAGVLLSSALGGIAFRKKWMSAAVGAASGILIYRLFTPKEKRTAEDIAISGSIGALFGFLAAHATR